MSAITGKFIGGKIVLNSVPDWPDGSEVCVNRDEMPQFQMLTEDEQSDDPADIEKWITDMEAIPPHVMDPEDEAKMFAALNDLGEYSIRRQLEDPPKCPDA